MTKVLVLASIAISIGLYVPEVLAEEASCATYSLRDGIAVSPTPRGPKIMSTATVSVAMDDQGEVIDAMNEASLVAKSQIAEFLNNTIQSDKSLEAAVETQIQIVDDQKMVTKSTVKKQLTQIRSTSAALLRGAVRIGECYTKGKIVRITIGLKPETTGAASEIEGSMTRGETSPQHSEPGQLNGVDSFNNSSGIDQF